MQKEYTLEELQKMGATPQDKEYSLQELQEQQSPTKQPGLIGRVMRGVEDFRTAHPILSAAATAAKYATDPSKLATDLAAKSLGQRFQEENPIISLPGRGLEVIIKPTAETLAKPFGEATASAYELPGKQPPAWTEKLRLASPELRAAMNYGFSGESGLTPEARQVLIDYKTQGAKGAGFMDLVNVLSLFPIGGPVAKGAALVKGAITTPTLKGAGIATLKGAGIAAPWGTATGVAQALDNGITDPTELIKNGAFGALVSGAFGAALGVAPVAIVGGVNAVQKKMRPAIRAKLEQESRNIWSRILNLTGKQTKIQEQSGKDAIETIISYAKPGSTKEEAMDQILNIAKERSGQTNTILHLSENAQVVESSFDIEKRVIAEIKKAKKQRLLSSTDNHDKYVINAFERSRSTYGDSWSIPDTDIIKSDAYSDAYKPGIKLTEDTVREEALKVMGRVLKEDVERRASDVPELPIMNNKTGELYNAASILWKNMDKPVKKANFFKGSSLYPLVGAMFGIGEHVGGLGGFVGGVAVRELVNSTVDNPALLSKISRTLWEMSRSNDPAVNEVAEKLVEMIKKSYNMKGKDAYKMANYALPEPKAIILGEMTETARLKAIAESGTIPRETPPAIFPSKETTPGILGMPQLVPPKKGFEPNVPPDIQPTAQAPTVPVAKTSAKEAIAQEQAGVEAVKPVAQTTKVTPAQQAVKDGLTVEEFMKGQGTPLYHGSDMSSVIEKEGFKKMPIKTGVSAFGEGSYFFTSKADAKGFGGVVQAYVPKDIKLKAVSSADAYKVDTKQLIKEGFGGTETTSGSGKNIVIFDQSQIKTTSQLRAEYADELAKSKGANLPKPSSAEEAVAKGFSEPSSATFGWTDKYFHQSAFSEPWKSPSKKIISELSIFKKNEPVKLYRGVNKNNVDSLEYSSWTYDKNIAKGYAGKDGVIEEKIFQPEDVLFDTTLLSDNQKKMFGYDYKVDDKEVIVKTTSQHRAEYQAELEKSKTKKR